MSVIKKHGGTPHNKTLHDAPSSIEIILLLLNRFAHDLVLRSFLGSQNGFV